MPLKDPNNYIADDKSRIPGLQPEWYGIGLQPGEEIMQEFQASFFVESIYWWVAIFFTLGLAFPFFILRRWARKRHRWAVSNKRIMSRLGVFNRTSTIIEHEDILDTNIDKPLLAGLWGNGKVLIESRSGGEGAEMIIWRQHNPDVVRDIVIDAAKVDEREKEKEPSIEEQVYKALLRARGINTPRKMSEEFSLALQRYMDDEEAA